MDIIEPLVVVPLLFAKPSMYNWYVIFVARLSVKLTMRCGVLLFIHVLFNTLKFVMVNAGGCVSINRCKTAEAFCILLDESIACTSMVWLPSLSVDRLMLVHVLLFAVPVLLAVPSTKTV